MSSLSRFRQWKLLHFTKPLRDRSLFRFIVENKITNLVRFGLESEEHLANLIQLARQAAENKPIRFIGIDRFEGTAGTSVGLKSAHRLLHRMGISYRLLPGDALPVLMRFANEITDVQAVVFSPGWVPDVHDRTWFYLPRMMAPEGKVLLAPNDEDGAYRAVDRVQAEAIGYASLTPRAA